jgi:TetR/AcrR family transcriptional repressor of nem operon
MNAGRPREFDTDKALESAMQQFWRVGYEATSLQDLLKAMRLSKSSLYQTFGSKHELFLRSIDIYQRSSVDELQEKLNNSRNSKVFLKDFLESVIAESTSRNKKGCLLVNTINELAYRDKAVSKAVAIGLNNMAGVIRGAIELGKKEGAIDAIKNTDMLVNYFITNVCGLRTLVKSGADKSELLSVVNMIIKTVY